MTINSKAGRMGKEMGRSTLGMVNLFYQNNTAINFLEGLIIILEENLKTRIRSRKDESPNKNW